MTCPHNVGNRFRHLKRVFLKFYILELRDARDEFLFMYPFLDAAPALEALSLNVSTTRSYYCLFIITTTDVYILLIPTYILTY
jgi:hypothetical protein